MIIIATCTICGNELTTQKKFCSYKCMGISKKGKSTYQRTSEHNKHMSKILTGRPFSKEHCKNLSKALKGNPKLMNNQNWKLRDQEKANKSISTAMKRPEVKQKISNSIKKLWENKEYRNKQIIKHVGKINWKKGKTHKELFGEKRAEEIRQKMRKSNLGKKYSNEINKKKGRFGKYNAMSRPEIKLKQILSIRDHGKQWKGGISYLPYSSDFTEQLKIKIKDRDFNTCQLCFSNENLQIHHIDYDKQNSLENNLITLCSVCHGKTNWHRAFWQNLLRKNDTAFSCRGEWI